MNTNSKLTPELELKLREVWNTPVTNDYIAESLGITCVTLIKYGKILGLEPRHNIRSRSLRVGWSVEKVHYHRKLKRAITVAFAPDEMMLICLEAERRRTTPEYLCQKVLQIVMKDHITDAVLDDALPA